MLKKILLVGCITLPILFVGCDSSGSSGSNSSNSTESGKPTIGCANLKAGTECNANKACSNHFLCLTGQGSDKNCSNGCSCQ